MTYKIVTLDAEIEGNEKKRGYYRRDIRKVQKRMHLSILSERPKIEIAASYQKNYILNNKNKERTQWNQIKEITLIIKIEDY